MTIRIHTFTGRCLDLEAPSLEDIDIRDIAHHLALIPRWGGAVREHYSVAQHSVLVAQAVARARLGARASAGALLHDAHEAYACDVIDPLWEAVGERYRQIEALIATAIGERFDLGQSTVSWALHPVVREADLRVRAEEARDLIEGAPVFDRLPAPRPEVITPWSWRAAEERFLEHAAALDLHRWDWLTASGGAR